MRAMEGQPFPLGITFLEQCINFAIELDDEKDCEFLLFEKGKMEVLQRFSLPKSKTVYGIRCLKIENLTQESYEYEVLVNGIKMIDQYVYALASDCGYGEEKSYRSQVYDLSKKLQKTKPIRIPDQDVIAYKIHVRGYTKHGSSKVKHKGTFQGILEKLDYIQSLGVNQLQLLPCCEFDEVDSPSTINYWGYKKAYWMVPKLAYSSDKDAIEEFANFIRMCHEKKIEIVIEMPFEEETSVFFQIEVLRFWVMNYGVDGFLLNSLSVSLDQIKKDPILKHVKIIKENSWFQTTMRRFLKGDEGTVLDVISSMKSHSSQTNSYNYIASNNGFTLNDLFTYEKKYNEANGEHNKDGTNFNYSWNCGAEGNTRKKHVLNLRERQIKNALAILFFSQGTPCLLAGDEFGNSQKGNNNAYCQDNLISWIDWKKADQNQGLIAYVKELIDLRKRFPNLSHCIEGHSSSEEGIPSISFHGENAWQTPCEIYSRQLGVMYTVDSNQNECYVAFNMHWNSHFFALPLLPKGKKWYQIFETGQGSFQEPKLLSNQRQVELEERCVSLYIGK